MYNKKQQQQLKKRFSPASVPLKSTGRGRSRTGGRAPDFRAKVTFTVHAVPLLCQYSAHALDFDSPPHPPPPPPKKRGGGEGERTKIKHLLKKCNNFFFTFFFIFVLMVSGAGRGRGRGGRAGEGAGAGAKFNLLQQCPS